MPDARDCVSVILSCPRSNDEAKQCEELDMIRRLPVVFPGLTEDDTVDDPIDERGGICPHRGITFHVEPPRKLVNPIDCFVVDCSADSDELGLHTSRIR